MTSSRHLDPFDLDVSPNEELPSYEPHSAPSYNTVINSTRLYTYHLRQTSRREQQWVPYGPATTASYQVTSYGSVHVFSRKPDMEMVRIAPGAGPERSIASISFDNNDGQLPWRPRAHFTQTDSQGVARKCYMESRNLSDWVFAVGGTSFAWRLEARSGSLVLREKMGHLAIARFTYSTAANGADVGELAIYRDALSVERDGMETILASLMVPIGNFKRMGRRYWGVECAETSTRHLTGEHAL